MGVFSLSRRRRRCAPDMINELLESGSTSADVIEMDAASTTASSTAFAVSTAHSYPPSLSPFSTTTFTLSASTTPTSPGFPSHSRSSNSPPTHAHTVSVYARWVKRMKKQEAAASAANSADKKKARKPIKDYLPDRDATIGGLTLTFTAIRDIGDATNIGYMKGLAGLALLIIEVTEGVRTCKSEVQRLTKHIVELINALINELNSRPEKPSEETLYQIDSLQGKLLRIHTKLQKMRQGTYFSRLLRQADDNAEIIRFNEDIKHHLRVFGIQQNLNIHSNLSKLDEVRVEQKEDLMDVLESGHQRQMMAIKRTMSDPDVIKEEEGRKQVFYDEPITEDPEEMEVDDMEIDGEPIKQGYRRQRGASTRGGPTPSLFSDTFSNDDTYLDSEYPEGEEDNEKARGNGPGFLHTLPRNPKMQFGHEEFVDGIVGMLGRCQESAGKRLEDVSEEVEEKVVLGDDGDDDGDSEEEEEENEFDRSSVNSRGSTTPALGYGWGGSSVGHSPIPSPTPSQLSFHGPGSGIGINGQLSRSPSFSTIGGLSLPASLTGNSSMPGVGVSAGLGLGGSGSGSGNNVFGSPTGSSGSSKFSSFSPTSPMGSPTLNLPGLPSLNGFPSLPGSSSSLSSNHGLPTSSGIRYPIPGMGTGTTTPLAAQTASRASFGYLSASSPSLGLNPHSGSTTPNSMFSTTPSHSPSGRSFTLPLPPPNFSNSRSNSPSFSSSYFPVPLPTTGGSNTMGSGSSTSVSALLKTNPFAQLPSTPSSMLGWSNVLPSRQTGVGTNALMQSLHSHSQSVASLSGPSHSLVHLPSLPSITLQNPPKKKTPNPNPNAKQSSKRRRRGKSSVLNANEGFNNIENGIRTAARLVILGEEGIGKTGIMQRVVYHPSTVEVFGSRRVYVDLEGVEDAEGVLRRVWECVSAGASASGEGKGKGKSVVSFSIRRRETGGSAFTTGTTGTSTTTSSAGGGSGDIQGRLMEILSPHGADTTVGVGVGSGAVSIAGSSRTPLKGNYAGSTFSTTTFSTTTSSTTSSSSSSSSQNTPSTLLILDNLHTAWTTHSSRFEVERLLTLFASRPRLALVVTLRGNERPLGVRWTRPFLKPVRKIGVDDGVKIFSAISDKEGEEVRRIVEMCDGIPGVVAETAQAAQYESLTSLLGRARQMKLDREEERKRRGLSDPVKAGSLGMGGVNAHI